MSVLKTLTESLVKELSTNSQTAPQSVAIGDQVVNLTFNVNVLSDIFNLVQFQVEPDNLTLSELTDLTSLTGGDSITLPDQIPSLNDIVVQEISFTFSSVEKTLKKIELEIGTSTSWTIIVDVFTIEQLTLDIEVEDPLDSQSRSLSATVSGVINAWGVTLDASLTSSLGITAALKSGETLNLSNLLEGHIDTQQGDDLEITELMLDIEPADKTYKFQATLQDQNLSQNQAVQFTEIGVDFSYDSTGTTCNIAGNLTIAGVDLMISASIPEWEFTGEAAMDTPIQMGQLIQDIAKDFGSSSDLPEPLSSLELSDISFTYTPKPTAITFSSTIEFDLADGEKVALDLDIDLKKNEDTNAYDKDITGKLTIGQAELEASFKKDEKESDLEFSWNAVDGGALTVSDFLDWFDSDLGNDIPSGIDLGLASAKLTYSKEESTTSVLVSATFSGGEQVFLFGTKAENKWSLALGLGINSDQADQIDADLKKGVEQLHINEPTLTLLLSDISQADFKAPEALEADIPGIDGLKVGKGLYLVAGIPIKGLFDFIRSKVGDVFPEIDSDDDVLLAIGFTDAQNKTGLTIEFEFPGPITFGNNVLTIEDILFQFSITDSGDSPNILLALSGKSSINVKKLSDGFFEKAHLMEGDEIDILVAANIDLGTTGLDLEFRGVVNAESHGKDVALLHILPGLWIGGLEFLIGIGGDEDSTIFGIGAETKISPMDQPPSFDSPSPDGNNPFKAGRSFLIVCELDAEVIPVPIYLSLQQSNMDNVNNLLTLFTGLNPEQLPDGLQQTWDVLSTVLNVVFFGILNVEEQWVYYADPNATKTLVLPDGTTPKTKGVGIQGTAKVVELFQTYAYLAYKNNPVPGTIPTGIKFESVVQAMSFGPFKLDAPADKGVAFPNYNKGSGNMASIEKFQKGKQLQQGSGNSPFFELDEDKMTLSGALQVEIGNLKQGNDALNIGGDINIDLKSKDPRFSVAFHVDIDLLQVVDDIIGSLLNGLGGLGDILKAIVEPIIKALEDVLDPSIAFDTAITISPKDFAFAFHVREIGLNNEIKLTNLDFGIAFQCDPEKWVIQLGEQVGSQLWDWFKEYFVDDFLGAIGKAVAAAVEAVAKVFAAVAAQEWDALKEIVEGVGDAFLDIFSGNFGNLGHDFEAIGEGIATACGFGTSYSNQQLQTKYKGVYLAPGAQVALSLFENYQTAQHHVFFFDSSKDVNYQGPSMMGTISSYDVSRAQAEQRRFVAMKENLALNSQIENPDLIQKSVGRRVAFIQTDNQGNELKDAHGNLIKLMPGDVTLDIIPDRYADLNDSQPSYPYAAPTVALSLKSIQEDSGIQLVDNDAAFWFIMPAISEGNKGNYSIIYSTVETEDDLNAEQQVVQNTINAYTANYVSQGKSEADANKAALAQYQKEQQPTVGITTQFVASNAELKDYQHEISQIQGDIAKGPKQQPGANFSWFKQALKSYEEKQKIKTLQSDIESTKEAYTNDDAVMIGNAQPVTASVSGQNVTYNIPKQVDLTPKFLKAQGLNNFRASLDGFYLSFEEGGKLVARRLANATQNTDQNVSGKVANMPDAYPSQANDSEDFITGSELLNTATFELDELKNSAGNTVAFAIKSIINDAWVSKDLTWTNSREEQLCFAPKYFDKAPSQRIKLLSQWDFSSANIWEGGVNVNIENKSYQTISVHSANNCNESSEGGQAFTAVKSIVPNSSFTYTGNGNSNVFAVFGGEDGLDIIGIYEANSSDNATIIVTEQMAVKRYQFEEVQILANGDKFTALDGKALGETKAGFYGGVQLDIVNPQSTDYELWLGQEDGSFKSANFTINANSYACWLVPPGQDTKVSNVIVFKKAGTEEIMAAYQLQTHSISKNVRGLRVVLDAEEPLKITGDAGVKALEGKDFCQIKPEALDFELNVFNETQTTFEIWFANESGYYVPEGKIAVPPSDQFLSVKPPQSNQWNLVAVVNSVSQSFVGLYQISTNGSPVKLTLDSIESLDLSMVPDKNISPLSGNQFGIVQPQKQSITCYINNGTSSDLELWPANENGQFLGGDTITPLPSDSLTIFSQENGSSIFILFAPDIDQIVGLYQFGNGNWSLLEVNSLDPININDSSGLKPVTEVELSTITVSQIALSISLVNHTKDELVILPTNTADLTTEAIKLTAIGKTGIATTFIPKTNDLLAIWNKTKEVLLGVYKLEAANGCIRVFIDESINEPKLNDVGITALETDQFGIRPGEPVSQIKGVIINSLDDPLQLCYADSKGLLVPDESVILKPLSICFIDITNGANTLSIRATNVEAYYGFYQVNDEPGKAIVSIPNQPLTLPQVTPINQITALKGVDVLGSIPVKTTRNQQINFYNFSGKDVLLYGVSRQVHQMTLPEASFSTGTNAVSNYGQVTLTGLADTKGTQSLEYLLVMDKVGFRTLGYYHLSGQKGAIILQSSEGLILENKGPFSDQVTLHDPKHVSDNKPKVDYRQISPMVNIYNGASVKICVAGTSDKGGISSDLPWSDPVAPEQFIAVGEGKSEIPNWLVIGHVDPQSGQVNPAVLVHITVASGVPVRLVISDDAEVLDLVEYQGAYKTIDGVNAFNNKLGNDWDPTITFESTDAEAFEVKFSYKGMNPSLEERHLFSFEPGKNIESNKQAFTHDTQNYTSTVGYSIENGHLGIAASVHFEENLHDRDNRQTFKFFDPKRGIMSLFYLNREEEGSAFVFTLVIKTTTLDFGKINGKYCFNENPYRFTLQSNNVFLSHQLFYDFDKNETFSHIFKSDVDGPSLFSDRISLIHQKFPKSKTLLEFRYTALSSLGDSTGYGRTSQFLYKIDIYEPKSGQVYDTFLAAASLYNEVWSKVLYPVGELGTVNVKAHAIQGNSSSLLNAQNRTDIHFYFGLENPTYQSNFSVIHVYLKQSRSNREVDPSNEIIKDIYLGKDAEIESLQVQVTYVGGYALNGVVFKLASGLQIEINPSLGNHWGPSIRNELATPQSKILDISASSSSVENLTVDRPLTEKLMVASDLKGNAGLWETDDFVSWTHWGAWPTGIQQFIYDKTRGYYYLTKDNTLFRISIGPQTVLNEDNFNLISEKITNLSYYNRPKGAPRRETITDLFGRTYTEVVQEKENCLTRYNSQTKHMHYLNTRFNEWQEVPHFNKEILGFDGNYTIEQSNNRYVVKYYNDYSKPDQFELAGEFTEIERVIHLDDNNALVYLKAEGEVVFLYKKLNQQWKHETVLKKVSFLTNQRDLFMIDAQNHIYRNVYLGTSDSMILWELSKICDEGNPELLMVNQKGDIIRFDKDHTMWKYQNSREGKSWVKVRV